MFKPILAILLLIAVAHAHDFTNCGSSTDLLKVSGVTLTPDPPVKGQNLGITLAGTVGENVTGGQLSVNVYYLGIQVVTQNFDLCTLTTCPVAANAPFTGTKSIAIPSFAPAGAYDAKVTLTDSSSKTLGCVELKFNL